MPSLPLPEKLDRKAAIDLSGSLLALRGDDVTLDASEMRDVSPTGLELLLAAQKQWQRDGKALIVSGLTADAAEALAQLGADAAWFARRPQS